MANMNLLKSKMTLFGDMNFVQCLADLLNISRSTASKKLNGLSPFTDVEITVLTKRYGLSGEDIKEIFVGAD
jgi:hypothetical protein